MRPSIGRVVHYVHPDTGAHMPALVLAVQSGGKMGGESIALRAFGHTPADDTFASAAVVDLTGTVPGSWHWPEREDAIFPANDAPASADAAPPPEAPEGAPGAESRTEAPIDEAPPEYVPVVESPAAESGDSRPV